jgi:thioredoxin reductase (NADPH)
MDFNVRLDHLSNSLSKDTQYDVIMIGGGPAGTTAAIYTSRAGLKTLVIDKGLASGALGTTARIANYPGIGEEISGAELVEKMRKQAQSFGAQFTADRVVGVDLKSEEKSVYGNNQTYTARAVVIATGSMGRGRRVKGEDELLGRGVSYCATCDAAFFKDQEVAVAGNTDEAIEEGLYLAKFASRVHFLIPPPEIKAPRELVDELEHNPKITLYQNAVLREIKGEQRMEAVVFIPRGEAEQTIPVSGAFVYLQGSRPITDFLQEQLEVGETGCLSVDHEFQTGIPGVFAVGDVLCDHVKQAVIAASDGAVAGIAVEKMLRGRKKLIADWSH